MLFRRKKKEVAPAEPPLVPVSGAAIDTARDRCRDMVRQRALVSAGVAAVPLPGVDILSDLTTFTVLVEEVNREFGLSQQQIERLHPRMRVLAYQAAASVGGMLVGKIVTRNLVLQVFKKAGIKIAARTAAKVVPLAGQVASAAIGFALFRRMGYQHVEACVKVARELEKVKIVDEGVAPAV
ncbi:hypothetical protein LQ564_15515 [Massilia sp. G4R7]|uniref:DUF697 domain-containing protein n=1 Tax=Massilia phyllostachyos TaxID=2898585 RepID=A0ABS8Q7J4_9BURK|nr:hypothetical protein [Massilia phyllostachyos]MCD2517723.1 hypothetical protein [Massilia phyllostachyos]